MEYEVRTVTSQDERTGAMALRQLVFVGEQGVPAELEHDEHDAAAVHAVAVAGGEVVATGRLVPEPPKRGRIGRMAVAQELRRRGLGSRVLEHLEEEARRLKMVEVTLHAQLYVERFYTQRGYIPRGEPFTEAGIRHVTMAKRL